HNQEPARWRRDCDESKPWRQYRHVESEWSSKHAKQQLDWQQQYAHCEIKGCCYTYQRPDTGYDAGDRQPDTSGRHNNTRKQMQNNGGTGKSSSKPDGVTKTIRWQ